MHRPLPKTHPEFTVLERPSNGREFRVENNRVSTWRKPALIFPVVAGIFWPWGRPLFAGIWWLFLLILVYNQLTQVIWESVVVLPTIGLRLETHKGPFGRPLFISSQFIPLTSLSDVIINEGLRGWDVRYYLAALITDRDATNILVAYETILPRFPVLHKVYLGIHELLWDNKIKGAAGGEEPDKKHTEST